MLRKKKEFEDFKDLLVSFRLYFIIVEVSLCISTMYYLLLLPLCILDLVKVKLDKI
jgi:hypothetical protein